MEYLQIFDKNKNILNEKIDRRFKRTLKNGKHYMVTLIFIKNKDNKFLVQYTSKAKKSLFAITGGHVSYGDNSITTAIKETEEELGIKLTYDELKYIGTTSNNLCFCDIYYVAKDIPLNKMKLQKEEVESVYWLNIDEIKALIKNNKFRYCNILPLKKLLESI